MIAYIFSALFISGYAPEVAGNYTITNSVIRNNNGVQSCGGLCADSEAEDVYIWVYDTYVLV